MIIASRSIPYKYGDTIRLKPIFDVHLGNRFCDVKEFKKYLTENDTPSTYFIGGGDLLDSIIVSDAKRYRKSDDATDGDDIIDQQVNDMRDILLPYKDRILGLCAGNHEDVITKRCSTNPTKRLCEALDTQFLGYSCLFQLKMRDNGGRGRMVTIRLHHGWGGGSRTRGANITKFERDMGKWDADIFLYGHVHQKQFDRMPRLGLSGSKLISKPQLLAICGTYLKTYSDTCDPSWAETRGFPPVEMGGIVINIKPMKYGYDLWAEL
jgi:hypothetical protein